MVAAAGTPRRTVRQIPRRPRHAFGVHPAAPRAQIQLVIRNSHTRTVRINWIHGAHVNEIRTLAPGMSFTQTVFLSHTLHAEDVNRKGDVPAAHASCAQARPHHCARIA